MLQFYLSSILLLLCVFIVSCSHSNKNEPSSLTEQDARIVDAWAKDNVPECRFLYTKSKNNRVRSKEIIKCLDDFESSVYTQLQFHYSKPKRSLFFNGKLYDQFIDYSLYNKLEGFINQLSVGELNIIFKHLMNAMYAANPKFIKQLIGKGVSTKEVVYVINHYHEKKTCKAQMLILKNNIHLYRDDKYLNTRQPEGSKPKDLLIYQLANIPSNSHCIKVVELLIRTNPDLKNSRTEIGETPLHIFMEFFGNRFDKPVVLAKKLITAKNINSQDNYGRTPLRVLLDFLRYYCPPHNNSNQDSVTKKDGVNKCNSISEIP